MSRFRACKILTDDRVVPAIFDVALDQFVGFVTENGNDELAGDFERNPSLCLAFDWLPFSDTMKVIES